MIDGSPVWQQQQQQSSYGHVSPAHLPNEILEHIFHHLSPVSLAAVTAVTSSWNAVAERLLYASISVVDVVSQHQHQPHYDPYHYQPPRLLQPWRTIRVCQSLLRRPHLAEGVRRLHIRWHGVIAGERPPMLEHVYRRDITAAVRVLPNLESLELALGLARDAVVECSPLFHDEHRQPYEQPRFEHMRHLALSGVSGAAMCLHPRAMPCLTSFRGSPTTAASIVPGRAVHTLALIGHGQDAVIAEDDLRTLAVGCAPLLRELDLSAMSVTPVLLSQLAAHFSTIELLRVKLALRHTLHYALSGIRMLVGLTTVLKAFHRLSTLDLSPTSTVGVSMSIASENTAEELALCSSWGDVCPTLAHIIFPSNAAWHVVVSSSPSSPSSSQSSSSSSSSSSILVSSNGGSGAVEQPCGVGLGWYQISPPQTRRWFAVDGKQDI